MKITRQIINLAVIGSILAFSACSGDGSTEKNVKAEADSADSKKTAEDHNEAKFDKVAEKDAQAAVNAYESGLFEIKLAENAKEHATTKEAKSLAEMVIEGHERLNTQLKDLASKKQISLPTDITAAESDKIKKMDAEKKLDFDKKFASSMVDGHKDAINTFEKASKECTDGDLANWFSAALPELRKHLDAAMNTEDALKKMKR